MSTSSTAQCAKPQAPNAIACLNCRSKHVKCDLQMPSCRRCTRAGLSCAYHKSRRGRRPHQSAAGASAPTERVHGLDPLTTIEACDNFRHPGLYDFASDMEPGLPLDLLSSTVSSFCHSVPTRPAPSCSSDGFGIFAGPWSNSAMGFGNAFDSLGSCIAPSSMHTSESQAPGQSRRQSTEGDAQGEKLIALFYKHFHPAHPFMLPYRRYLQNRSSIPPPVQVAMQFAGSHFINTPGQQWAQCPAAGLDLGLEGHGDNFFYVQGLLILAIVYYGRNEAQQSVLMLSKARTMALALRLHEPATVSSMAKDDLVMSESVLRTWWELGNVIALMSVFSASVDIIAFGLPCPELDLPCEEKEYRECCIPPRRKTLQDFFDRAFSNDGFEFSSFAYKIEATRLLMSIQGLGSDWWSIDKDRITTVDNSISNYHLSIPVRKRDVMGSDGTVDEVLFAAKIATSAAIILITRPRSGLVSVKERPRTTCTEKLADVAYETSGQYTFQATQAADGLADAAGTRSSPCAVMCHSPFYACAMALASIIHLPVYVQSDKKATKECIKERIKLTTNTLARIGENWPIAKVIETQILEVAREVLCCKQPSAQVIPATSQNTSTPTSMFHADWPDRLLGDLDFMSTLTS